MKKHISDVRSAQRFANSRSALLSVFGLAVGSLFVWSMLFGSTAVVTTKVAAQQASESGATQEMLAFALNFNTASNYAVYGGRGVRNQGVSTFRGSVGSDGKIEGVAGMPDGVIPENRGQAKQDLRDSILAIDQLPCTVIEDTNLGGKTFDPGVYCLPSANLDGQMTVNASDDPNARFVFRLAGKFDAQPESGISLIRGALATTTVWLVTSPSGTATTTCRSPRLKLTRRFAGFVTMLVTAVFDRTASVTVTLPAATSIGAEHAPAGTR